MKSIFNLIFSKNTKSNFLNLSSQQTSFNKASNSSPKSETEPQFSIFANELMKENYQVAEISFDEFNNSTVKTERRKASRKSGETRSSYNTMQ